MAKIPDEYLTNFDDFCFLTRNKKADLLDGVIWIASPELTETNQLWIWLACCLGDYVEVFSLGDVYGSRVAFRLDRFNAPEPDIAFVAMKRRRIRRRDYIDGPPDLALEIVAPDSVSRDYHEKRKQYQEAGVGEYWIVNPLERKVTALRLGANGRYRVIRPRNGILESMVIPGFWIRVSWLWQTPLPAKSKVLTQIMSR